MVMNLDRISYGSLSFFLTLLHNIFLIYHVEVFVSVYRIDKTGFWVGELVFLLWNSINDPLFGWLSDKRLLRWGAQSSKVHLTQRDVVLGRIQALQRNGPLLGCAFLLFWFEWLYPSVQFVVCLCLYDAFLTMVDLHHSALLADLALDQNTRATLNMYCSLGSGLGALSVFVSHLCWHNDDMSTFRWLCGVLFVISVAGFYVSTSYLKRRVEAGAFLPAKEDQHHTPAVQNDTCSDRQLMTNYIKDLLNQRNFWWFSLMHLVQVFHCHFNSNFFPLFIHALLFHLSPTFGSVLIGLSFILPHVNNIYFLNACKKHGAYKVVRALFCLKLVLSLIMFCAGMDHIWLLCIFIASNRIFTEGTCKLLNLVISDLVDEDFVLRGRRQPVSALIFGSAAFVAKPGQTLAPLVGVLGLSWWAGRDIFQDTGAPGTAARFDVSQLPLFEQETFRWSCFQLLTWVPILCALIQLAAWRKFALRGSRLDWIKSARAGCIHGMSV